MSTLKRTVLVESSIVTRWVHVVAAGLARHPLQDRVVIVPPHRPLASSDMNARRVVEGSRLLARVEGMFRLFELAWREAMTTGAFAPLARDVGVLSAAERVRLLGWILFVAALMTGVWRALDRTVSWSMLLCVLTVLGSAAVMKWNAVIATAWTHWSRTRPPNARI